MVAVEVTNPTPLSPEEASKVKDLFSPKPKMIFGKKPVASLSGEPTNSHSIKEFDKTTARGPNASKLAASGNQKSTKCVAPKTVDPRSSLAAKRAATPVNYIVEGKNPHHQRLDVASESVKHPTFGTPFSAQKCHSSLRTASVDFTTKFLANSLETDTFSVPSVHKPHSFAKKGRFQVPH